MRFAQLRKWLACCLIFALFSPQLMADRLVMKNGDVITGAVSKVVDGKVYIKPGYSDEFAVNLDEVESVNAEKEFELELGDGQVLSGTLDGGDGENLVLMVDDAPMTIAKADFVQADEPKPWYERNSKIDVNMTWNDGNTDSRNNLIYADTGLRYGDHRHFFDLTVRRDETDGVSTKKQDLFNYSYNWIFSAPWYGGLTASWERDPIKELDHRYKIGAILGRDMIDNNTQFLTISGGLGYSEEKYVANTESGATALWSLKYTHKLFDGAMSFFHNDTIDYQFYGENNAIIKTNTGFNFDIVDGVYTAVSLRYDYETEPPVGAENEDITLAIGVGAKF